MKSLQWAGLLWSIVFAGCFKKQSHEIVAPEMPNYQINGRAVDVDLETPLANIAFQFNGEYLLYDCPAGPFDVQTDSLGSFKLTGMCPGFYSITAYLKNVAVQQQRFELKHGDTTLVLRLPKLLNARLIHSEANASGLTWLTSDSLAFAARTELPGTNLMGFRIFAGDFERGFFNQAPFPLANEYPELSGLAVMDTFYYSFSGGLDAPVINKINMNSYNLVEQLPAPHRLVDLSSSTGLLYATTTRQSLVLWRPDNSSDMREYPSPGDHPRGIAAGEDEIWTADEGRYGYPRLYRHSGEMTVERTFVAVDEAGTVLLASHLALNPLGELWGIVQGGDGSSHFYRFSVE